MKKNDEATPKRVRHGLLTHSQKHKSQSSAFGRLAFMFLSVSLFIGLRGINGTLTAFLGLLTDFKRKLDLAVVAIPPKAGKSQPIRR